MLRKSFALAGVLLLLAMLFIPAANGSVPKIIVAEDFGATW